ncbi:MAG: type II toxin-antitoxin system RelE/ParE family toxin [Candidatus Gracilibacteria bacterium]|nr:type II toxin-antitoxin system RelE/ParE family toxin [Candidatus Gracilibacteria bacterium]
MYSIEYSKNSRNNLNEIFIYINNDNSLASINVINNILNTINYLKDFSNLGLKYKNGLRKLVNSKHKFTIIYKIDEEKQTIIIVSIFKYKNTF